MTEHGSESKDRVGASNENEGNNTNNLDIGQVGRDVNVDQTNNIEQRTDGGYGGAIPNPNTASGLHDFFAMLSKLPYFESVVVPGSIVSGGLGFMGTILWLMIQYQGFTGEMPSFEVPIYVIFASTILLGFGATYDNIDSVTECPECETRFAFDIDKLDITNVTPLDSKDDIIHADVTRVCRSCGHSKTYKDDFTPEEINRFRGNNY